MRKRDLDSSPPIAVWALALGAVGFACGFFGPIALNPGANQGPLLGIFITGPGGLAAGLAAGVIARALPVTDMQRWIALGSLCLVSAAGILVACLPTPQRIATVLDAEVRGCRTAAEAADAATADWEQRIAEVTWSPPRKNWESDVARMLAADPGVVVDLHVTHERDVYENRKPWNQGTRFAGAWREAGGEKSFFARFAGSACDAYPNTGRRIYWTTSEASSGWPPVALPNYLGLAVMEPEPAEHRAFAGE